MVVAGEENGGLVVLYLCSTTGLVGREPEERQLTLVGEWKVWAVLAFMKWIGKGRPNTES